MPSFSVDVNVGEIVDGVDTVVQEIRTRYLSYVALSVAVFLLLVGISSCLGTTCGIWCYDSCYRRRRRRKRQKLALLKRDPV